MKMTNERLKDLRELSVEEFSEKYRISTIQTKDLIRLFLKKGSRVVQIHGDIYEEIRARAKKEGKTINKKTNEILMGFLFPDDKE